MDVHRAREDASRMKGARQRVRLYESAARIACNRGLQTEVGPTHGEGYVVLETRFLLPQTGPVSGPSSLLVAAGRYFRRTRHT